MQWPTGGKSDGGQLPLVPVEAIQDVFSFWACSGFGQVNGFVVLPKPFLAQEGVRSHFGSSASAGLRRPQEAHRSLLECGRRRFHWRPQTKAHCGGPLYVDYDEFPNYGGTSFEGCVSGSYIGPRLRSALWRAQERVCVMVVSVEHLALCVTENDGSVCAYASASYS